jgi:hypothetical protein
MEPSLRFIVIIRAASPALRSRAGGKAVNGAAFRGHGIDQPIRFDRRSTARCEIERNL